MEFLSDLKLSSWHQNRRSYWGKDFSIWVHCNVKSSFLMLYCNNSQTNWYQKPNQIFFLFLTTFSPCYLTCALKCIFDIYSMLMTDVGDKCVGDNNKMFGDPDSKDVTSILTQMLNWCYILIGSGSEIAPSASIR